MHRVLATVFLLGTLVIPRPALAEHTDIGWALVSYVYGVPLSLVVPSVFGADLPVAARTSGPRFLLGWAWQVPLARLDSDYLEGRHRLLLELALAFGQSAADPQGAKVGTAVNGRIGYRYILERDPSKSGFSALFGAGGAMEAYPRLSGALYPEIGLRYRPHSVYPIVLAIIGRCDFRFRGEDLIRPSIVLSISLF